MKLEPELRNIIYSNKDHHNKGEPTMANDVTKHPYGPGSHAPFADVREMPACYPIKGNFDSMLYHRPDSQNYGATIAEVWFDSPLGAEAAGFVLAPRHSKDAVSTDYEPGGSRHPCSIAVVDENRSAVVGVDGAPAWADDAGAQLSGSTFGGAAVVAGAAGPSVALPADKADELSDATGHKIERAVDPDDDSRGLLVRLPKWLVWALVGLLALLLIGWLLA
ncbi:MAG: hypothetical protein ACI81L_003383 [Verrucomicrobiales bacterium]|jgi:hypothetical protein